MRDLLMLAAMSAFVPMAIADGFVAYLLWAWTSVFAPNYYLYGFMAEVRYNLLFASIALFALVLGRKHAPMEWSTTQRLFLALLIHATLCALFGYTPNRLNLEVYEGLVKALVFCMVMSMFVHDRLRLHVLLVAIAFGMGFHGLLEGAKFVVSGGGHKVQGIATSMISDNNHFAVGLLMVLPILFYLYQYSERRIVRLGFLGAFVLTAFAIVGTFSRGGFIGLAMVGIWLVFSSRRKFLSVAAVGMVAMALLTFAPEAWFDRIDSINNASEDSSFMGRVIAWKISAAIALDNPIFGGGFHAVQAFQVWNAFKESIDFLSFIPTPAPEMVGRAAHSIYFEVLGDMGFVGLLLFLAVWANAWRTAQAVKRATENDPERVWARDLSDMMRVSLLVYAVSGAAVSMAYFELFYMIVAMTAVLKRCALGKPVAAEAAQESPVGAAALRHDSVAHGARLRQNA